GSEIVDRDPDAEIAQSLDGGEDVVAALHQRRLRELDFEASRRESGAPQDRPEVRDERLFVELDRRHVHAEDELRIHGAYPGKRLRARFTQRPHSELADLA